MKIFFIGRGAIVKLVAGVVTLFVVGVMSLPPVYQAVFQIKRKLPIYNVQMEEKKVAVSFDAAWGADDTPKLLEALKNANAKGTFFLVGKWAEKYPAETKMIADAGHELGNHSYTHPDMTKLSEEGIQTEILKGNEAIKKITGKEVALYRPPFGAYSDKTMTVLDSLNMHTIQWDVDSLDWKDLTSEQIVKKVVSKVNPGSIVLFHNNAKHTAEALPIVLKALKEKGYQFVSISDIIIKDKNRYYIDHRGTQIPKNSASSENTLPQDQENSQEEAKPTSTEEQKQQDKKRNVDPEEEESEDVIKIIDTTL